MKNKEDIKTILNTFERVDSEPIVYDENSILSTYAKGDGDQSLSIKILSVFGGVLASITLLGFLFLVGLYGSEEGLLIFGIFFILFSIAITKGDGQIIMDTFSVSFFIIGFILVGLSLMEFKVNENVISIIFILIASVSFCIADSYVICFLAILAINASIIALILFNESYYFSHIYVSVLAFILTYVFMNEAQIIKGNTIISKRYNAIKIGLVFSFLSMLSLLSKKGILPESFHDIWLSSVVTIVMIVFCISKLFVVLNSTKIQHKVTLCIVTTLLLVPTALSPGIPGAILVILLSFYTNYKTGFVIGIVSFLYFISRYYYDLNFTLLTKAILLFISGVLFIALYLFTNKKLTTNEEV